MVTSEDRNEDWVKKKTWDVRTANGTPVRSLRGLLALFDEDAAIAMLDLPVADAMPRPLRKELMALRRKR